jgi:phage tail sheath protein FI
MVLNRALRPSTRVKDREHTVINFPRVYIQEISSGGRKIMGVSTSIAAFIGWAAQGPTDCAQRVLSFQDFVHQFGGLDRRSLLGYAIQHFFANGGQEAYVVRLAADDAVTASVTIDAKLLVTAVSPGSWANDYRIETKQDSLDATRFGLAVIHQPSGQPAVKLESFENLSMQESDSRFVINIVNAKSAYVQVALSGAPATPPAETAAYPFSTAGSAGTPLNPNEADFESKLIPVGKDGGIYLLDQVDLINILCVPGETTATVVASLQKYCHDRRAFLIIDSPKGATLAAMQSAPSLSAVGTDASNSALYFPWIRAQDPLDENRVRAFPPSGFVAGIYARTDNHRGVWKAPAGIETTVSGAIGTEMPLTDDENGTLNRLGINCIRTWPVRGPVVWGSCTLHGNDALASEWKYVSVRRLALFIEESLLRGTWWIVFEPNDESLWSEVRLSVDAFMNDLFRQGALQGTTPREAYFVKCDRQTMTANDINYGIVNILVGFAALKPDEFMLIRIQQKASLVKA